jgi:hypothetical protein
MRTLAALLFVLLLCVDGWGCGGQSTPDDLGGWCCDGLCGLTAEEKQLFDRCTCDGVVLANGECLEYTP